MTPAALLAAAVLVAPLGAALPATAQEPAATPSASPRPGCGAPPSQSVTVEPAVAAPGDTVTVTVRVRDEPCHPDESRAHAVDLFVAREPYRDPAPLTSGSTDASGRFVHVERATVSATFYAGVRDGTRRGGTSSARLTVDRTAGSCTGALTLDAPPTVEVGRTVVVRGRSSATSTVDVAFRRRGQTAFTVRRHGLQPSGEQGAFSVSFTPDDDHRLVASDDRCDSPPVLVQAVPTVAGPASVRRGSVVTLTVRTSAGLPVALAFRRSGQASFAVRRTGTADRRGLYTTTYRADADHAYYAVERPGQRSATRTTRVR